MLGIFVPSQRYSLLIVSKKQTWALCHEACEEMRENEINTRNKAGFGYIEYDASLKFLSGDTKWIIYTYIYLCVYI